jgi:putative transposase
MIEEQRGRMPVQVLCQALGVSASAYYEWRLRAPSARETEDRRLAVEVRAVHRESRRTYGARRIHAELRARGVACGRHRVARLMREGGLVARGPRRKPPRATPEAPLTPVAENVLDRAFAPDAPDRVWTADITHVWTVEGWLYLAVVVDLFSRRVVGWAARPSLHRELAVAALTAALRDRRPAPALVCHSDQGTQYTSSEYRALLRQHEVVCSMSRRGNCHDNAPTESLFGSLKTEAVRGERFTTHAEARAALFDYLAFYNHRRRHSALGYVSPAEYERRHQERQAMRLAA